MSTPGPILGPCESWITSEDVLGCCKATVASSDDQVLLDEISVSASMLAFELSGRQFTGLCGPVTVRPCRQSCGCWGPQSSGVGPWAWSWSGGSTVGNWAWRNECGEDRCGCGTASYIKLAGYPVREVIEVKMDGVALDPSQYKLEKWTRLMRTSDPGPPPQTRLWPACQDLGLDDDQPGTYSVTYVHGVDPPDLGRSAAAALACELYTACRGGDCKLPSKVTQVARQGVTMQRIVPLASLLRTGATGLPALDAFIAAYNPDGLRRRPMVYSPDIQRYARREI